MHITYNGAKLWVPSNMAMFESPFVEENPIKTSLYGRLSSLPCLMTPEPTGTVVTAGE